MATPIPPKFAKRRHHFVPQFWLRGFRGQNEILWKRREGAVSQAALANTMAEDWLYTIFDDWWRPSDALEDAFSEFERAASLAVEAFHKHRGLPDEEHWIVLLMFLALTATRHPDTMLRGNAQAKSLTWMIADVHSFADREAFNAAIKDTFGPGFPAEAYEMLRSISAEELFKQAEQIDGLSPHDPRLPQQDAVRATMIIARAIGAMDLDILDAPSGSSFVLGDRPLPLKNLGHGFSVPLSQRLAICARPPAALGAATQHRKVATPLEVAQINSEQAKRSKSVVIGPDAALLASLM